MLVEQNISPQVATQILGKLNPGEQRALDRVPESTETLTTRTCVDRARATCGRLSGRLGYFRDAARLDRSFSATFADLALADVEILLRGLSSTTATDVAAEARNAASHAVALDSCRTCRGAPRGGAPGRRKIQRDVAAGLRARDRARPSRPGGARGVRTRAGAPGDRDAGRPLLERALIYEPGRAQPITALAGLAIADHRDGSACTLLNRAIVGDVLFAPAWAQRAVVRAQHGDLRFAWADAETATQLGESHLGESAGAMVDLLARDTSRARDRLYIEWSQVKAAGAVGVTDGTAIARAMIAAGQSTRAYGLELARPRGLWFVTALRDPAFDTLRGDKRFLALTTKQ